MAPRMQIVTLNGATTKGKSISTTRGMVPRQPLIIHIPLRTPTYSLIMTQMLVSNHHSSTKTSSFRCLPT